MEIDENSSYLPRKFSYILNDLRNYKEIFRKDVTYDDIKRLKATKKQSFTLFLEDTFLEKFLAFLG